MSARATSAADARKADSNPGLGSAQQLRVDPEIAAHQYVELGIARGERVHLGRNVVLDVAGGEQHARKTDDPLGAARFQRVQPLADHRTGEFEEPAFDVVIGKAVAKTSAERVELVDGVDIAAAVAAEHDGVLLYHGAWSLPPCVMGRRATSPAARAAPADGARPPPGHGLRATARERL